MFLINKEVPDEKLLNIIKGMVKDGKSPKKNKERIDKRIYIYYPEILYKN